ncbi:DUF808 domain-containing protein [Janibacter cremeus]|uniref:DUF808 domain-containing protein n=1 Tax=Janibacter cremeus TaxID=1285192 RepID=A0A852VZI2_9MICO|nr:DUF808 domain-containing protein [Janibacter cremeus]NYF99125.1 hypothetical protein [Janibacter cremeus]
MSGGLVALLDDISVLARMAAASVDDVSAAAGRASAKAAGVVVDDTAVTPQYVEGLDPKRELPIIKRITVGSLRNKLVFIIPAILLLNAFLPWALSPLLMIGGTYLCFEGAEKIWEKVSGHGPKTSVAADTGERRKVDEDKIVSSAVTTDFILSAEIMVISLKAVLDEGLGSSFWFLLAVLVVVAVVITLGVYGTVGLIVKMDDIGLHLTTSGSHAAQRLGRGLVKGMPKLLTTLSVVGVFAMLWVGGHIILVGLAEDPINWPPLYDAVHHLEVSVADATGALGGALGWLTNTVCSMILGAVVGAVVVAVMHVLPFGHGSKDAAAH